MGGKEPAKAAMALVEANRAASASMERLWKYVGGLPSAREIRAVCVIALIVYPLIAAASAILETKGMQVGTYTLGGDFKAWYVVGKIMNRYPHDRIYDQVLQSNLLRELNPKWDGALPYARAPFLALLFQPLAKLPFLLAYFVWVIISVVLYLAGLRAIWPAGGRFRLSDTKVLLALSFPPFLADNLVAGQISAIAFFGFAACIALEKSGRSLAAGIALAICANKPTLLVLALPMAVISGRLRLLAGFAAGACTLTAVSLYAVGTAGCVAWLHMLSGFASAAVGSHTVFRLIKYVDINTFWRLLFGGQTRVGTELSLAVSVLGFVWLGASWWRWRRRGGSTDLLWSATLAWTLVVGAYTAIYDTILIVPAVILMAGTVHDNRQFASLATLVGAVYTAAFFTQPVADAIGLQVFTPLLAVMGAFALRSYGSHSLPADHLDGRIP
jgi:hypothetical protein